MPLIWSKILYNPKTTTGNMSRQSRLLGFPIERSNFFRIGREAGTQGEGINYEGAASKLNIVT